MNPANTPTPNSSLHRRRDTRELEEAHHVNVLLHDNDNDNGEEATTITVSMPTTNTDKQMYDVEFNQEKKNIDNEMIVANENKITDKQVSKKKKILPESPTTITMRTIVPNHCLLSN